MEKFENHAGLVPMTCILQAEHPATNTVDDVWKELGARKGLRPILLLLRLGGAKFRLRADHNSFCRPSVTIVVEHLR